MVVQFLIVPGLIMLSLLCKVYHNVIGGAEYLWPLADYKGENCNHPKYGEKGMKSASCKEFTGRKRQEITANVCGSKVWCVRQNDSMT